jgi:hypothetical protein
VDFRLDLGQSHAGAGPEDTVTVMGLGGVGLAAIMVHEVDDIAVLRFMLINADGQNSWMSNHHWD